MFRWVGALLLFAAPAAHADDFDGAQPLTLDQIAAIKADQDRAKKEIAERYRGDDTADRGQVRREIRDALQAVLDDHAVDKNDYLKRLTHVSREDKASIEAKSKAINDARDPPPPKPADEPSTEAPPDPAPAQEGAVSGDRGAPPAGPEVTAPGGEPEVVIIRGFDESHPLEITVSEGGSPGSAP